MMLFIRREYDNQARELHVREDSGSVEAPHREQRVVVPVNGINRAVIQAVSSSGDVMSSRHPGGVRDRGS